MTSTADASGVKIVNLTLEMAQALAAVIPEYQRAVNRKRVLDYATAMREGRWQLVGDGIVLRVDSKGEIVAVDNAQHRILARIEAGDIEHEVPIIVLQRVSDEADLNQFLVMDIGKKRSLADYMKAMGQTDWNVRASIVSLCATLDLAPDGIYPAGKEVAPMDLAGLWWQDCDAELLDLALKRARAVRHKAHTSTRLLGALYYIGARDWDIEGMDTFCDVIRTGVDPEMGAAKSHPGVLLRDKAGEWYRSRTVSRLDARNAWMLYVRALHAHASGERMTRLLWRPGRDRALPVISEHMASEHAQMEPKFLADARSDALRDLVDRYEEQAAS